MRRAAESGTIRSSYRPASQPGPLEYLPNMSSKRSLAAVAARPFRLLPLFVLAAMPLMAAAEATPAVSTVVAFSYSTPIGSFVKGLDGALYGVASSSTGTSGLIYRSTVDGSSVTTLHQLGEADGVSPQAGLLLASDDKLYGTTLVGRPIAPGSIFSLKQDGTVFTTLHTFAAFTTTDFGLTKFNTDGADPVAELTEGSDGNLYGVTRTGGPNGTGVIFRMGRDGTGFQTLHAFSAITSEAAVTPVVNAEGKGPAAPLVEGADGKFYGTASLGGASGRGTVFRINFDGTGFEVLHAFTATTTNATTGLLENAEGATPYAGLIDGGDGFFYGVASQGGTSGNGTIFAISPDGTTFTTLHSFDGNNGSSPVAELALFSDGKLYGTTAGGGTTSAGAVSTFGTIFSIARDGTGFTKLHSFDNTNGVYPAGQLLELSGTVFLGTTGDGGKCGSGTIFRYSSTGDTVQGNTRCGQKKNSNSGGGVTGPAVLLLIGGVGWARRRRR